MTRTCVFAALLPFISACASGPATNALAAAEEAEARQVEIIVLQHAAAEEMAPVLRDRFADRYRVRRGAQIGPVQESRLPDLRVIACAGNRLALDGRRDRVAEALELIARLDVPAEVPIPADPFVVPAPSAPDRQVAVVVLQHTDAAELVPLLNDILDDSVCVRPVRRQDQPSYPDLHVQPDRAARFTAAAGNRIVIDARLATIAEARELIARLDVAAEPDSRR